MIAAGTRKPLPPVRVRREPPTIEEAVFAAQGLTGDVQQQVMIAASLMGVSEEEVRPHVARASAPQRTLRRVLTTGAHAGSQRTVVVERKPVSRLTAAARGVTRPR